MNENDYAKFCEHFDDTMKNELPEAAFSQELLPTLKAIIRDYVLQLKEFWKVETMGPTTIVYYKAKFTKETEDVVVKVVFQEIGEEIYITGLWFDSPKLRGQ